ncbi:MarR family winged helix-turn-helix transcriptional regulator [Roseomonas sp. NAR14]|uniref:MarR family winged helix-turn-helix transcriptional regulator n=1 Tax=Roseomonas acroporae TaxID=2937791 RepID=A0A9X1Y794_9PROT|nr:MarR family winged helix-turn-helix transcriptional regulator [Roseomonas acroporae]MCK8785289.1 MarR family winged helix-turn-helix transcriptional regulator [Roseomonas acroporae]
MPSLPGCAATPLCQDCTTLRLADFLPYRLSVVTESVSRAFADRYEAEFGLGIPEWRVMAVLGEGEPLSTQSVIVRTEMDRVKVSRAVIRLVDKGLVSRSAHPEDQRAHMLALSPAGEALYRRIVPRACGLQAALAETLSEAELAALDRILTKLHRRAARLLGREDEGG